MDGQLRDILKRLRLSGLAQSLDVRLQEAKSSRLDHAEFLELILQDEMVVRRDRQIARLTKAAAFRELKSLDDFADNPWRQFTWIKGNQKPLRHFGFDELRGLIDWFGTEWNSVPIAQAFIKVSLWSWARRSEVSGLKWSDERRIENECHFKSIGKWGVVKWFRLPEKLREELESLGCDSEYVFGDFPRQLIDHYHQQQDVSFAKRVREDFAPYNLGDWMYRQIVKWSESQGSGDACLHIFRKTGLQFALAGEHVRQEVADDARITAAVMSASYAQEFDEELRLRSNRTFRRILSSLPSGVAALYGYEQTKRGRLSEQLDEARAKGNWKEVSRLAAELLDLDADSKQE